MFHQRVFSLGIWKILNRCIVLPSLKCPRVSHACIIFLREKYVAVRLLSISFSFFPLHCLGFRDVPFLRFQSRDLGNTQHAHSFAISKMSSRCLTRWKYFYVKSAWMWDCFRHHLVFFHCIVLRLAMCHSRVFSLGILEILKRCKVLPSLKCLLGCVTRGKYFYVKTAWIGNCCRYQVVLFLCIVSCLAMCNNCVFGFEMFEILNRWKVPPSIKCGGSLTCVFTDIVFTIGILGILNWCKVSPSLIYPCDFLTVRLRLLSISCNVVI